MLAAFAQSYATRPRSHVLLAANETMHADAAVNVSGLHLSTKLYGDEATQAMQAEGAADEAAVVVVIGEEVGDRLLARVRRVERVGERIARQRRRQAAVAEGREVREEDERHGVMEEERSSPAALTSFHGAQGLAR